MKWLLRFLSLALLASTITTALVHPSANAVTASDWQAGRIIDDGIFTNSNGMSVSDIQNFLNSLVPNCDTNGTQPASEYGRSDLTHAQYAASRGWPAPPYVCLRNFYEVPKTSPGPGIPANNFGGSIPAGAISAAQMIYNAAQQSQINPKVLLVMIQKESSGPLTTDTWPLQSQYTYAMGAHCPDTAPCDANYAGFSIQVSESAALLRWYLDSMTQSWWQYKKPYATNSIYWSPNLSCGAGNVYIETKATAALYTYTPYQPNAAALANMYGLGDGCSAYGNRNFWRIYSDWFGVPNGSYFNGDFRAQSDSFYIMSGEKKTIYMQFINTGGTFWKDDLSTFPGYPPIHLAATNPINRWSDFRSPSWLSGSRPNGTFSKVLGADGYTLAPDQHTVQTGQIAEFQFDISVPLDYPGGVYREYFQPIAEGTASFSLGTWASIDIKVVKSNYTAQYSSQGSYPTLVVNGSSANTYFNFKNAGNVPWYDDTSVPAGKYPVHLATSWPINRTSRFASGWPYATRPDATFTKVYEADGITLAANQHVVNPGQIAQFSFSVQAPSGTPAGFYKEYFQPILEGAPGYTWNMGVSAWLGITVQAENNLAQYSSQSSYPTLVAGGSAATSYFNFKNAGNVPWYDDTSVPAGKYPVHLATSWPINRTSRFASGWPYATRPDATFTKVYEADGITLAANQHVVNPGQIAQFSFSVQAPSGTPAGFYKEYFQPILEGAPGYTWNMGVSAWLGITVN